MLWGSCVSQNPCSCGPRLRLGTRDICMRFAQRAGFPSSQPISSRFFQSWASTLVQLCGEGCQFSCRLPVLSRSEAKGARDRF